MKGKREDRSPGIAAPLRMEAESRRDWSEQRTVLQIQPHKGEAKWMQALPA